MNRRTSTTRRALVRLRAGLLLLTAVTLTMSVWSFAGTIGVLESVRDRTAPAVLDVTSARASLLEANSDAIRSFHGGGAQLVGAGEQYETGLAVANQDLARAAEHNAAGEPGSRELQLVAGLLTAYNAWMGESGAQLRASGGAEQSAVYLWYAERLLTGDDQVVSHLDALANDQRAQLDHQVSSGWLSPASTAAWAVPALALLVLVVWTQLYLRRRFRRHFNEWLIAATVLVLGLGAATSTGLVLAARAHDATQALHQYAQSADQQALTQAASGESSLIELVRAQCDANGPQGCGETLPAAGPSADATAGGVSASSAAAVTAGFTDATAFAWLLWLIPALAVAAGGCVLVGLQPRIDEYRYRT
ncbi:hypothetical protein FPZ12_015980 [Amycolatopsis acidicola]|uniref:Uncharacterized protein n=1 Tax=Amycolatopsis acidicola TaxID=2596893 RepID=A0A5N0V3D2_9PSEU|nr:hypothetical protein [Amycolatopsis acidicola]KAA9160906.1 hypothetical protein FPZ12_015980 [Amycolatopsis acidicola]